MEIQWLIEIIYVLHDTNIINSNVYMVEIGYVLL